MPTCPAPNFSGLRRECYKVTFEGDDDAQTFTHAPFSSLEEGDYFTLEPSKKVFGEPVDPLAGEVACERLFKATSEPYMSEPIDGEWLIDCERI